MTSNPAGEPRGTAYELFILLLSFLSIFNAVLIVVPFLSGAGREVVIVMETLLTPLFLVDFLVRLRRSRPRSAYLVRAFGWADLLAIVPMLRIFRLFRVVVVLRHLRARGPARIAEDLSVSRATATFFTTIFLVIVVLELAGMLILDAEGGIEGANIRTPSDALWWGYVTITTVGYGDRFPVTLSGRIIGIFLLTAGVALFSVFTGFIANAFLAPRRRPLHRLRGAQPSGPLVELEAIRRLVSEQDDRSRELQARLDDLHRALVAQGGRAGAESGRAGAESGRAWLAPPPADSRSAAAREAGPSREPEGRRPGAAADMREGGTPSRRRSLIRRFVVLGLVGMVGMLAAFVHADVPGWWQASLSSLGIDPGSDTYFNTTMVLMGATFAWAAAPLRSVLREQTRDGLVLPAWGRWYGRGLLVIPVMLALVGVFRIGGPKLPYLIHDVAGFSVPLIVMAMMLTLDWAAPTIGRTTRLARALTLGSIVALFLASISGRVAYSFMELAGFAICGAWLLWLGLRLDGAPRPATEGSAG